MPQPPRILLIDDVPMFRELGSDLPVALRPRSILPDCGSSAFQARGRAPAHDRDRRHAPARHLRRGALRAASRPIPSGDAPRIVLDRAARLAPRIMRQAVRAGADDVLFKPLERDALIACVRRLTEFDTPRGLPRADLDQPVAITTRGRQIEGKLRNVSRGGVFIDTTLQMNPAEEVGLSFSLDGNGTIVAPTARVVWSSPGQDGFDHVGLRFLEIDADTVEKLDHYVNDHYPQNPSVPA